MKPATLRKRHLRLRPTGYGVVFIIVLSAMTVGSMNYNINLGFLLTFLLGAMALVSVVHTCRSLKGLDILSVSAKPVFAGQTAIFQIQCRLESPPGTTVFFSFSKSETASRDFEAERLERVAVKITANQRGRFNPGPLWVSSRYPFGLFRLIAGVPLNASCLVYPKPVRDTAAGDQQIVAPDDKGDWMVPGIDDFQGLKAYQPGEALEHIYWKAFSRGQGLQTKHFAQPAATSIVFDWQGVPGIHMERKLSVLCDCVIRAHRLNLSYGLKLPDRTISPDRGKAHRQNCLRALALYNIRSREP